MPSNPCPLCTQDGGDVLWRDDRLRVVAVEDADYPGFTRVIWNAHVAEMTDLVPDERTRLMDCVLLIESVMREYLTPHKINLAAFGNMVPHLHWHIIPRWRDDKRFPEAYWAAARRVTPQSDAEQEKIALRAAGVPLYHAAVVRALDAS